MSTTSLQAESSKPQKKMQECKRCKAAGFPDQLIGFEKIGEDPVTGKIRWKLVNENSEEHIHKSNQNNSSSIQNQRQIFKHKRVVDIATVTDLQEGKNLLALGWEYKTSYPATIANIPHYVFVKKE